jgi:hypothetical protein
MSDSGKWDEYLVLVNRCLIILVITVCTVGSLNPDFIVLPTVPAHIKETDAYSCTPLSLSDNTNYFSFFFSIFAIDFESFFSSSLGTFSGIHLIFGSFGINLPRLLQIHTPIRIRGPLSARH